MSTFGSHSHYQVPRVHTKTELDAIMLESERSKVLTDQRIENPMLLILLGSTPALAALEVMRQLLTLDPSERRRVGFAFIDTDTPPLELTAFRQEHIGVFQEFDQRISVPAHITSTTWPEKSISKHMLIPKKIPQYFSTGAGGIRNNGHVALAFNHTTVRQTLELALASLLKITGEQGVGAIGEVQVNVIVFGGGGTGSGITPDILVMAREMLVKRGLFHRLNLFAILPEQVSGANDPDASWRKSNSVALLLEVMSHPLAASEGSKQGSTYHKYLHKDVYEVGVEPLANEVFLIGYTGLGEPDKIARMVGMDLFMRGCDASGVGFLEKSKWVDRRVLARKDERKLTTNFGFSLPLEIFFPAHATANAFGHVSAAYLINKIVGSKPPFPDISTSGSQWRNELDAIVDFYATPGAPYYVQPSAEISEADILYANEDSLDRLWGDIKERMERTAQEIQKNVTAKYIAELALLYETPSADEDRGFPLVARHLRWLWKLDAKYTEWEKLLEMSPPPPAFNQRLVELEAKYFRPIPIVPEFILQRVRPRYARLLHGEYNNGIQQNDFAVRWTALRKMVIDLRANVKRAIKDQESWYEQERIGEERQRLYQIGTSSPAWQGKLDRENPHQRHIFNLRTNQSADNPEMQVAARRLYLRTTFPDSKGDLDFHDTEALSELLAARFVKPCLEYISKSETVDLSEQLKPEESVSALQSRGKDLLSRRIIEFFEDYYLYHIEGTGRNAQGLMHYTLFQLIEWGYDVKTHTAIKGVLLEHMKHMQSQMRMFLSFEPGLDQTDVEVDCSLYLGVRWDEVKHREIMDQACIEMGKFGSGKLSMVPKIGFLIDPHRLQIVYGIHGISLSVLSDFHRPFESMMSEYLKHQREWVGAQRDGNIRISFGGEGRYGQNEMPVHSSEEMERLVCDQHALMLNDPTRVPQTLYERVIRDTSRRNDAPDWVTRRDSHSDRFPSGSGSQYPDRGGSQRSGDNSRSPYSPDV